MKYFVVSDPHSFYNELKTALKQAGFNKKDKNHTLIVLGDVFDRGPDTVKVYKFLKSIPKKRCILIIGNHELLYRDLLKKSMPDDYDYSNHTVDTFCHIAGYSPEVLTTSYWYRLGETGETPYDRIRQTWKEIVNEVKNSPITAWLSSKQWKSYFELNKYVFVHSFIPLKNLDGMPAWYTGARRCGYFKNWRTDASVLEQEDSTWGCPYQKYLDGYFKDEASNGKVLVCGHWVVTDFRRRLLNKDSDDTSIFYSKHLIGLDCGVWHCAGIDGYWHPQNVMVLDSDDFDRCYDQRRIELEEEEFDVESQNVRYEL